MRLAKRRKVRPDDPVAVVTRFLDAANHHDADGLRACVHPEFESFQPLHPARNFRGAGQLISNWRAIFEAEPGFRLTLLRASTTGNTVWAEVHGAGASAEAAGIFIVGVEDGRIRWIRVYSDLVEPLAEEPVEEPPAPTTPPIDWDRDPIRLVPPREAQPPEGEEAEATPAAGEEPEVAAAAGEPPTLRLVGSEGAAEPEAVTDTPEAPSPVEESAAADTPSEAGGGESIEVLVGEAPEVEVEADAEPAAADAPPDVVPEVIRDTTSEDSPKAPPQADEDEGDDEEAASASLDTVARLGGAAPEPPDGAGAGQGQPSRRRRGFLRRGGAR